MSNQNFKVNYAIIYWTWVLVACTASTYLGTCW